MAQKPKINRPHSDDSKATEASLEEEFMGTIMSQLIEMSHVQMVHALELTKFVIECNKNQALSEEEIFAVFQRASNVMAERFPLGEVWKSFLHPDHPIL